MDLPTGTKITTYHLAKKGRKNGTTKNEHGYS